MIKNLLFAATAFVALSLGASAQTVVWSDNFDDEDISDWTLHDEDGDGANWGDSFFITDSEGNPATPVSLISRSWSGVPMTPDNWAVSPQVDLTTATTGIVLLNWKVLAAAADWDQENYSVYVGTSTNIADMTQVFTETYDDPNNEGTQYDRSEDISSFAGQIVYIAFRHHNSTDMDFISIDDVEVVHDTDSSTENFAKLGLNVFPNPVSDIVNITSPEANIEMVTITDLNGRTVKSINFNNVAETTIDASDLASGIYLMNITANGTVGTQKIVKK